MESQQLQEKLCLGCLKWAGLWSPESLLWPIKLWRGRAILSLPPDWSKRIKPNRVMTPHQYRTCQSHRSTPTLLTLQRRTPTTKNRSRASQSKINNRKHSMSLCQVPLCLVYGPSTESVPDVCVCVCVYVCVCLCCYVCMRSGICVYVVEKQRCCLLCVSQSLKGPQVCVVCDQLSFTVIPYH